MRLFYAMFGKVVTCTLSLIMAATTAEAHTYLAVASGNFSNSTTWGGEIPANLAAGDELIIPSGVTVTMDRDVAINGLLTLDAGILALNGYSLSFGNHGDLLINNSGALSSTPTSNISIASAEGFISNLTFTADSKIGDLKINTLNEEGIYLGSDLIITGTLTLLAGNFFINNHELYFAGNGDFSSEGKGMLSSTSLSDIGIFTKSNLSSPLRFSQQGNTIQNLTVNFEDGGNVVQVDANLYVTGTLVLASGNLDMGDQKLTLMRKNAVVANPDSYVARSKERKSKRQSRNNADYYTANSGR